MGIKGARGGRPGTPRPHPGTLTLEFLPEQRGIFPLKSFRPRLKFRLRGSKRERRSLAPAAPVPALQGPGEAARSESASDMNKTKFRL